MHSVEDARRLEEERILAGEYPGVTLVDARIDHNGEHGENPELIDEGGER